MGTNDNPDIISKLTIDSQDYIVFDLDSYQDVMYYRYNGNDLLIKHRFLAEADISDKYSKSSPVPASMLLLLDFLCIYRESLPDPAKMTES
jgi:hypothetical protein